MRTSFLNSTFCVGFVQSPPKWPFTEHGGLLEAEDLDLGIREVEEARQGLVQEGVAEEVLGVGEENPYLIVLESLSKKNRKCTRLFLWVESFFDAS